MSMIKTIRSERIKKLEMLKEKGGNPYSVKLKKKLLNNEIVKDYSNYEGKNVVVSGRLMSWRNIGKLIFANIVDDSGKIQLYINKENFNNDSWKDFKLYDVGDIVQVEGSVMKTKTGEISVDVLEISIISKSLRPLPEKWLGLKEDDIRFRRRYLDMLMNPEVKERFKRRSLFWKFMREFLDKRSFIEVNIPVLEHVTGGADAKPFVTHYDTLGENFFLRISQELYLKRLLGGGFEKVYDIGPRFRNEGISDEHLPEHIAMEFYWAYANYIDGMELVEEMFKYVLKKVYGTLDFNIRGFDVNLEKPWEVIKFEDIMKKEYGDIDIYEDDLDKLYSILRSRGYDGIVTIPNRARVVDSLWKIIRKQTAGPIFVTQIPKFFSPLSKIDDDDSRVVERFFPIIAGSELGNGFSELNDPIDQLDRFIQQQKMRDEGDDEAHMLDIDFVEMLEYGMPPAVGFGCTERVFWFFEDVTAREGVPFPQLKTEFEKSTLDIYKDIRKYFDRRIKKKK